MKKFFATVAMLGVMLAPMVFSAPTAASHSKPMSGLASTPAPVGAGGGIATAIGLVGAPTDFIFALRGDGTTDFWQYKISENNWASLASTPLPVGDGAALVQVYFDSPCSPRDRTYSLATLRGNNSNDFWLFNIKANSWCASTSTPAPVGAGGAIAQLQRFGRIYALRGGGTTDFWVLDSQGIWKPLANTPGPINAGGGLVGINYGTHSQKDVLYALQGGGSTALWKYDVATDSWTQQSIIPGPIGPGGSITAPNFGQEGTLVVLQGGGSRNVWALDVATDSWKSLNSPVDPVAPGGSISNQVNGCSFAIAGGGSSEFFSTGIRDCVAIESDPGFSINFAQPVVTATGGTKIKARLNIVRDAGFTGKITLTQASPKLQGIVVPEDLQIPESDSFIFKIKVKGTAQKGNFPITFAGVDTSGKVRNATLTLTVD